MRLCRENIDDFAVLIEGDFPGHNLGKTIERFENCRLTCAIGSYDCYNRFTRDFDAHSIKD